MRAFSLVLALAASTAAPAAQTTCLSLSECENLEPAERLALLERLQEAQQALRTGKWVPFTLMLGAMASNEMTAVAPREAFLRVDFAKAASFKRVKTTNKLWRPHLLTYSDGSQSIGPMGRVPFSWDIEVITGSSGNIERVSMLYRPPVHP